MAYKLITKTAAELDITDALDWYEEQKVGLAAELFEEIDKAFKIIEREPELFQLRYKNIRIVFTERFPYGIHYTIEDDKVFVHAVMKTSKKPKEEKMKSRV